jgi:hypothetical protein
MAKLTDLVQLFVLALLCTVLTVFAAPAQTPPQQIKADPGTNNPPPAGAILDLNGTPIPGGGIATYQHYTKNFIAGITSTAITFAFRDDPAQISFTNASVVDVTAENGTNLLTNGDFSGGVYTNNGNSLTPIGWTYANMYGAQAGGGVISGSAFCYSIDDVTVQDCWFDGAVQAYDAISQTITTIVGHTYQISFDLAEDSATFAYPGNPILPAGYPGSECWAAAQTGGPPCNFHDISTNGDTTDAGGNGINVAVYAQAGLPSEAVSVTHILQPGVQTIYTFPGKNDPYKITPSPYSMGGESLTITAVPIPKSSFIPPANFPNETCVPFADYSTDGIDRCVEYQADCSFGGVPNGGDCSTLLYTLLESYDLPSDLPAIGGPDFLVVHGSGCPTSGAALAQSIFTDYYVTRIDPTTKGSGGGVRSCFEVTYTPGAPPITGDGTTTSRFVGWESPIVDSALNQVKAGSTRPLIFNWKDNLGNPITNLTYCGNFSGTGCTAPWVNLSSFGIVCPNGAATNPATDDSTISSAGDSGFQNLGDGNYQMNWKIPKAWKGACANVQVTFDQGVVEVPAVLGFQFN